MKLLQIDSLHAQVLQALLGALDDVVAGEDMLDADQRPRWPQLVHGRNLGRNEHLLLRALSHLPNQPFAVPVAVSQRRIDKAQPQFKGSLQSGNRLLIRSAQPLFPSDSPRSISDLAHFHVRSAQFPVTHSSMIARVIMKVCIPRDS